MNNAEAQPIVAVVLVHWVNLDDTLECLASLHATHYARLQVIIVNNGSGDFNEERVHAVYPTASVIHSQANLGFTGGNNLGIKAALAQGADYVFLLNNDTVVEPELFDVVLPAFDNPKIGIVGPAIRYYEPSDELWFVGGQYSRILGYSYKKRPLQPFDGACSVDWICGCAMVIKRDVLQQVGLLWEEFFLNFEDLDLSLRARDAGYQCLQIGAGLVRHKVSASSGVRGTDQLTPNKAYYMGRNTFLSLRRRAAGVWWLSGLLSQFSVVLGFWSFQSLRAGNLGVMRHYLIGMWDGLRGRTGPRPSSNLDTLLLAKAKQQASA